MIRSMSGYGRGAAEGEGLRISFEVRSVNHRFCRIGLHLPAELSFFEVEAQKSIAQRVDRGKVDVSAAVRGPRSAAEVQVNQELAAAYQSSLAELAGQLGVPAELDLATLTGLPGVISTQTAPQLDPERHLDIAQRALEDALDALDTMRTTEGAHLAADMSGRFALVAAMVEQISEVASDLPSRYRDVLAARIEALVDDSNGELDLNRVAQEVAYYADRSDITEEVVRLRSHLDKAGNMIADGGSVGRSLEFLLQEMHREINTIGAKAKVVVIGDTVVELKSELERVREQVQNIE